MHMDRKDKQIPAYVSKKKGTVFRLQLDTPHISHLHLRCLRVSLTFMKVKYSKSSPKVQASLSQACWHNETVAKGKKEQTTVNQDEFY